MKKHMKLFMMAFLCLFVFTGCGNKELKPVEVFEKALKNTQEVKSLTMTASIDLKMEQDGATVEMPIALEVAMKMENDTTGIMKMHLSENPFTDAFDLYLDMNDTVSKVYMPSSLIAAMLGISEDETYWIIEETTKEENEEDITEDTNYQELLEKLKAFNFSKVLKEEDLVYVDEEGSVKHYTFNITEDFVNRVMEELKEEKLAEGDLPKALKLELYIDTENNRFTEISIDLADFITSMMEQKENEDMDFSMDLSSLKTFTISFRLTNYNSTTVNIPENVVNEAITSEQYGQIISQKYLEEE